MLTAQALYSRRGLKNSGTKNRRAVTTVESWLSREETELWRRLEFSEVTRLKARGEEKSH